MRSTYKNTPDQIRGGEKKALDLFHEASRRIPAYADFLKKAGINPDHIHSIEDFRQLPHTSKENYILKYPAPTRMWDGDIGQAKIIASSSGSTGNPVPWPRGVVQEDEAAYIHNEIYTKLFQVDKRRTLAIIAFPLGVYVSGIATTLPTFALARKYPITVVTAGLNKKSIIGIMKEFSPLYEQTLIIGHPFFTKDVLESAMREKLPLKKFHMKVLTCSEGFSEVWREYLLGIIGSQSPADIINTYGSSEFLLMGHETATTISLRKKVSQTAGLSNTLFGSLAVPNLFEFDPLSRYIESDQGTLLITAASGTPLIRYKIGDRGGVYDQAALLKQVDIMPAKGAKKMLPVVALHGRLDHSLLFHGINIYPEQFHHAFNSPKVLRYITGRFFIETIFTKKMNPVLSIAVELKDGVLPDASVKKILEDLAEKTLLDESIEYRFLTQHVKGVLRPKVSLKHYQDPRYFSPGTKPKYIRK